MDNIKDMTDAELVAEKWMWKMQYCRHRGWDPARSWEWDKAEEAYLEAALSAERGKG